MTSTPPVQYRWPPFVTVAMTVGLCLPLLVRAAAGGDLAIVIETVDATRPIAGRLVALSPEAADIQTADGRSQRVARTDLRSLTLPASALDSPVGRAADRLLVLLTNGDELQAHGVTLQDEHLLVDLADAPAAAPTAMPLEDIRGCLQLAADDALNRQLLRQVLLGEFTGDTLLLSNGDRLQGELRSLSAEGARITAASGDAIVPPEQWRAIVWDPALASVPSRPEQWASLQLQNGDRLTAATVTWTDGRWELTLPNGVHVATSSPSITRIDFFGSRVLPLTATPPARDESRPFLSQTPKLVIDRNVDYGPLTIGQDPGTWGLGAWSGSRLIWLIPPGTQRFEVSVGVDAATHGGGSVDFVLLVDGHEAARSGRRTGADALLPLGPIPVADAHELELRVDPVDHGDILDYADWLRPTWLK